MTASIDSKQILLCLLYLPGKANSTCEPIEGTTRIQKMMFLFEKEIYPQFKSKNVDVFDYNQATFIAYNYGPYSNQVMDDLRFFINLKLITENKLSYNQELEECVEEIEYNYDEIGDISIDYESACDKVKVYTLSDTGLRYTKEKILPLFSQTQLDVLSQFKARINSLSLDAIIRYVYSKYEDMTVNSKIKDKVLRMPN